MFPRLALIFLLLLPTATAFGADRRPTDLPRPNGSAPKLNKVESKYYWLYTDLPEPAAREAVLRLTRMGEEYASRTAGFAGAIRTKFPVYLFRDATDYYTAGGVAGSAGMFDGQRLLVIAGDDVSAATWHTMQHEGFHQFAHAVIGGNLPTWADEGLAEYFGEGIWTGDGFVTGIVPPWRLERIRRSIAAEEFKSITDVMALTLAEWNGNLSIQNYDQAWSMVHFLVHADNGRYRRAFSTYMNEIGRGRAASRAWQTAFGDTAGFEQKWLAYWRSLPADPSSDLYDQASVATIGSFLGRAIVRKTPISDYATFTATARDPQQQLPMNAPDWLPASLLAEAIERASTSGQVTLEQPANGPARVVLTRADGCLAIASVSIVGGKVKEVTTRFDDSATVLAEAERLKLLNETGRATAILKDALKRNADSPKAADMRAMIKDLAVPPRAGNKSK
ncbi:MAG TPA: DUF1570 domain-containing protein [Tepidisphaeraceae bacterium]|jgi:hypothetical protein|nr:DUF1570 domain-containing protein [Tepidisphaeraceae bacterium]